jgi:hypothetical protein
MENTSYYDERVKNLISVSGYEVVDKISLPNGEYDLSGSRSVAYLNKDGKDTGYAYVTTGKINGYWAYSNNKAVNIVDGKITNLIYGNIYKMLFNKLRVGKPSVE